MAGKTMVISLPASWVKKYGVKKGEELEVEEENNSLTIKTDKGLKKEGKIVLNVSGHSKLIRRYIGNLYKEGYDEIRLTFDNPLVLKEIEKHIDLFLGFQIVEHGKDFCIIKNVAKVSHEEFDNVFRRSFFLTLSLANESLDLIKKKEFNKLKETAQLEHNQNKQYIFCLRVLNKYGYKVSKKMTFMYLLVERLEEICDEYRYICDCLSQESKKTEISKEVLLLYENVNNFLKLFYDCYYQPFEEARIIKTIETRNALWEDSLKMLKKTKNKEDVVVLHHLINLIDKVYEAISPVFAIKVNLN